ncbi:cell division protein FtsZ [Qingshengfaniella alkalisoli]|uniref:Cell division protein FtsZ n=1 Tax=Qingshengfaniella alkalisoli TaxID=2599296 RepID=A0A5B8I953_9RHOB|nr:cell division protein FtsZ [Qingshengfaniella alkalisoli]QDY69446.1 cell division protein FtsZ [Qingshengfaniella alkalisoli]
MTLNLTMPEQEELKPKITVFGVGGAGGNAVNNMIEKELDGVEFVVANTDAQALQQSRSKARVQMGLKVTEGLGAGARPAVGAAAAEESIEQIVDHLVGSHMCFITAGMGGGTGTGAAPIIAQAARELGVLTVGVVTKPFQFEGSKRMRKAEDGVEALQKVVDTLIIIPNQNLFRLANEKTTFTEAFSMADDVLYQGVKGVTDLMVRPGLINLDFADVRAVMDEMGKAMMGTGEAEGEDRAVQAAEKAIANPLLDEISLRGAKGVLINITGGYDLTLFELDEAANRIREEVDPDANIIVGSTLDPDIQGVMRVSVVATGIDAIAKDIEEASPVRRRALSEPLVSEVSQEKTAHQPEAAAAVEAPAAHAPQSRVGEEEPTLFHNLDTSSTHQPVTTQRDDDLPPPAYTPHPEPETVQDAPESFVAPRPNATRGQPSEDTLRRLQAAVSKQPDRNPTERPAQPSAEIHHADKQRFGINSLINRMTGQGHGHGQAGEGRAQMSRPAPNMQPVSEDQLDEDAELDRIEIPAFLRRQAN